MVVRKTDEDGEATRSTPSSTLHSFGSAEAGSLGTEKIINMGEFSLGRLEQLRISCVREGGKH